jgi:hypothetical protein
VVIQDHSNELRTMLEHSVLNIHLLLLTGHAHINRGTLTPNTHRLQQLLHNQPNQTNLLSRECGVETCQGVIRNEVSQLLLIQEVQVAAAIAKVQHHFTKPLRLDCVVHECDFHIAAPKAGAQAAAFLQELFATARSVSTFSPCHSGDFEDCVRVYTHTRVGSGSTQVHHGSGGREKGHDALAGAGGSR